MKAMQSYYCCCMRVEIKPRYASPAAAGQAMAGDPPVAPEPKKRPRYRGKAEALLDVMKAYIRDPRSFFTTLVRSPSESQST